MTRETKIGLLVGLAFIIVIGILLSDHLTSTTEPASAPLSIVGGNTREGLTTIGRPSVPVTIEPPPVVEPRSRVATVDEMKAPETVDAVIRLAPTPPVAAGNPRPVTINVNGPDAAPFAPPVQTTDVLTQLAQKLPQDLEVITPPGALATETTVTQTTTTVVTPPAPAPGFTEYTVKEGDSLGRIASRLMGSSKKANQDAIVAANPFMKGDPDRIIVGRVYRIPTTATATVATATEPKTVTATTKTKTVTADSGTYWYNVKENDNLWKIAADQLGNGNAWTAIKELNKDILKGGETLHTNMRLRLPAKPVGNATASIRD